FAIAILMRENVSCRMGLETTDANLDRDVANLALHVFRQRSHLPKRVRNPGSQLHDFCLDLRRRILAGLSQVVVPLPYILPRTGCSRALRRIAGEIFDAEPA